MKTLGWPPNFVARCPVRLFEASGGSNSWQPSGAVGELHMRPLGNSMLHFQIHDLLDNQVLFEHTMRKPDAFIVSSERFFVIRLENGSFRGFGFTDKAAASEMKDRVQKAVKPFIITEPCLPSILATDEPQTSVLPSQPPVEGSSDNKSSELVLYESVPRRSSLKGTSQHVKEQSSPSIQPLEEEANLTPESKLHKLRSRWKLVLKGLVALTQIFGFRDHELEIGYPTDVKHVAHIGWDGPSIGGLSWMDELKPAPDFSTAPLREFGQPRGPDWIYDALAAAKWTSQGNSESSKLPPAPPPEFLDQIVEQVGQPSRQKDPSSRRKSKPSLRRQQIYQI